MTDLSPLEGDKSTILIFIPTNQENKFWFYSLTVYLNIIMLTPNNTCNFKISLLSIYMAVNKSVLFISHPINKCGGVNKISRHFTENTLFSLVILVRAPSFFFNPLQDQLELSIREKFGLHETERQLQLKIKTLQSCLKTEKDEVCFLYYTYKYSKGFVTCIIHRWPWFNLLGQVQKLQSIIASRASQYSHDAKRKEREAAKLKERLSQLLIDRKEKKLGKYRRLYTVVD